MIEQIITIFGFVDQACDSIDLILHGCIIKHEEEGWFVADYVIAAVGFLGVIVTLIGTSISNKNSRVREINREVASIKAALSADIAIIIKILMEHQKSKPATPGKLVFFAKWGSSIVFEAVTPRIGLLGESLSYEIVYKYKGLSQFDALVEVNSRAVGCPMDPNHHHLNPQALEFYQRLLPGLLDDFEKLKAKLDAK